MPKTEEKCLYQLIFVSSQDVEFYARSESGN